MRLESIETPALLLDRVRLERNVADMRARLDRFGVPLRLHGKTAKCPEIARLAGASSLTVSTLKEAEVYFESGFADLVYAVGLDPAKLDRVAALIRRGADLAVLIDSVAQARALAAGAVARGVTVPVLIELDCDGHRAGVSLGDPRLLEIAHALRIDGVELRGVLTHAGGAYGCRTADGIRAMAETERATAVTAAGVLLGAGLPCPVVSVGSTPTASFAEDLIGVTEVRAGVFVFMDLTQVALGVCGIEHVALTVLAAVIGHRPDRGQVIVDAGWTALSQDPGPDGGYGRILGHEAARVVMTNQEHGVIDGLDPARHPIGSRVRILPNHACATASMHDRYLVLDGGRDVEVWERFGGW